MVNYKVVRNNNEVIEDVLKVVEDKQGMESNAFPAVQKVKAVINVTYFNTKINSMVFNGISIFKKDPYPVFIKIYVDDVFLGKDFGKKEGEEI